MNLSHSHQKLDMETADGRQHSVGCIVNQDYGSGKCKDSRKSLILEINQRASIHYLMEDTLKGKHSNGICWISVFGMVEGKRTGVRFLLCNNMMIFCGKVFEY